MLTHRKANAREDGNNVSIEYAPVSGSMYHDLDVALWAKGRLKGGPGNFTIEIEDGQGFVSTAHPGQVITKNVDGDIVIYDAPKFLALYEIIEDDDEEDEQ